MEDFNLLPHIQMELVLLNCFNCTYLIQIGQNVTYKKFKNICKNTINTF